MTSKEALEKISWRYINDPSFQEWCNIINQALDRLETIDIELSVLEEIKSKLARKNATLYNENGNLKIENEKLKKENEDLNAFVDTYANAREELLIKNQNLEKVIEFLKEQFKITLDSKLRISDGVDCIQAFPLLMKSNEVIYDLLKEELCNDK